MSAARTLRLRKETLSELTTVELEGVVGGTYTTSFESCPTWICTPLIVAATEVARRVKEQASVETCP